MIDPLPPSLFIPGTPQKLLSPLENQFQTISCMSVFMYFILSKSTTPNSQLEGRNYSHIFMSSPHIAGEMHRTLDRNKLH